MKVSGRLYVNLEFMSGIFLSNPFKRFKVVALVPFVLYPLYTSGQIPITNDFVYQQDFNTLTASTSPTTWTNNSTLPGWYASGEDESDADPDTPPVPVFMTDYRGNSGTTSTGNLYSYGNSADRALGAVNQNDVYGSIAYGVHFENTDIVEIRKLTISMKVEQWRRTRNDNAKSHQRIKVGYAIGNPSIVITPAWMLDGAQFTEVPEAYLINDDTTSTVDSHSIVGNVAPNFHTVTVTFPVSIQPGEEFFLRFLDENAPGTDNVFGVDDLSITFSDDECERITAVSGPTVFAYIDMGMTVDIPDVGSPHTYIVPGDADMAIWENILSNFFQGNWDLVDAPAATYGYVLTSFTQEGTANTFYILRKTSASPYFWGTYAKATGASLQNQKLVLQAPHPANDDYTGRQAAAVWWLAGAEHLFIAGTGRCLAPNTMPSPCTGDTGSCTNDLFDEPYRQSDMAHAKQSIFHLATTVLAGLNTSTVFVQLHGFEQKTSQPDHFYISCGTQNALVKSVPDYPVLVRENLKNAVPLWDLTITHVDNDGTLGASDNTQGRFLNLHNPFAQYCEDSGEPVTVTNRFLHLEQYFKYRRPPCYYPQMANALGSVINDNEYLRQIRVTDANTPYNQYFDGLPAGFLSGPTHTWGNNLHIPGVYSVRALVGLFSNYTIDDGSSTSGGLYSFGEGGSSDRALGSLNDNTTGKIAYGFLFRNDTGNPIYGINLSYNAEQWRRVSGQTQSVKLSYAVASSIDVTPNGLLNDILFTNVPAGNLTSTLSAGNGSVNGNIASTSITGLAIPLMLPAGHELFLRFLDEDVAGTNDVAMALDNLQVTFSAQAMPVTWQYFEVDKSGKFAALKWAAGNEKACDRYDIQRSVDGKLFETISSLSCQNHPDTNHYNFRDLPPLLSPLVYYRICQFDVDGQMTYSPVRVFKQNVRQAPAISYHDRSLIIQSSQEIKPKFVSIIDPMGRIVAEGIPVNDGYNQFRLECALPDHQLFIVRVKFDNATHTVRMRTP